MVSHPRIPKTSSANTPNNQVKPVNNADLPAPIESDTSKAINSAINCVEQKAGAVQTETDVDSDKNL